MTIQEVIKMLVRIKDRINFEVTDSQKKMDALNMAIRSLEADRKIENVLYDIRNKITMLFIFDRESVVEIIDKHLKEVEDDTENENS